MIGMGAYGVVMVDYNTQSGGLMNGIKKISCLLLLPLQEKTYDLNVGKNLISCAVASLAVRFFHVESVSIQKDNLQQFISHLPMMKPKLMTMLAVQIMIAIVHSISKATKYNNNDKLNFLAATAAVVRIMIVF
eukprot:13175365-Ditylum_brightwellii.AAC.1